MRKIATTGSWQGELLHNRRDGTVFPVQVTTSAVKGAEGRVIGHVAICRDITVQHRPLGVVRALEKSSQARPLLEAIQEEAAPGGLGGSSR